MTSPPPPPLPSSAIATPQPNKRARKIVWTGVIGLLLGMIIGFAGASMWFFTAADADPEWGDGGIMGVFTLLILSVIVAVALGIFLGLAGACVAAFATRNRSALAGN